MWSILGEHQILYFIIYCYKIENHSFIHLIYNLVDHHLPNTPETYNIHNLILHEQWNEHVVVFQLLGLPDIDDDTYEQYHGDVEEEAETDHQQMGVSQ